MTTQTLEGPVAKSGTKRSEYIRWFDEIGIDDIPLVGGKNASLGEMCRELKGKGVKVPDGFAIAADAYRYVLREAGLDKQPKRFSAISIQVKSRTFASAPARCGRQS
jgi:pyruvate,water dikinase